jgi:hypothetical protein
LCQVGSVCVASATPGLKDLLFIQLDVSPKLGEEVVDGLPPICPNLDGPSDEELMKLLDILARDIRNEDLGPVSTVGGGSLEDWAQGSQDQSVVPDTPITRHHLSGGQGGHRPAAQIQLGVVE